jgi:cyclic pyranopterin phosphate synthase
MCKALSHEIVIAEVKLLEKSGGKREVRGGKLISSAGRRSRAQQ